MDAVLPLLSAEKDSPPCPLQPLPIPIPQHRFSHIHIDLVGPLQSSNNCSHILTVIDRTSKWMEAIPLVKTSAAACAKALTFSWISRFGVPETITSDRGPLFTSNLWSQLCTMLNIAHRQMTAYHPESNGTVERLHRHLKDTLRARTATATWADELPFVLLSLRAQPREDTGLSPAESVFGAPIVLPNEFLQCDELAVDSIIKNLKKTLDAPVFSLPRHNTSSSSGLPSELPAELLSAPLVWIRRRGAVPPLRPLYDGPYAVIRRGGRSFTLQIGSREEIVAVSRLKACTTADAAPGSLLHCGRPLGKRPGGSAAAKRPNGSAAAKRVSFAHPLASTPSMAPLRNGPGTVFLPSAEVFARPGPAAPPTSPQQRNPPRQRTPPQNPPRYPQRQRSPPQRMDL
jgi:hypothetical protein